MTKGVNMKICSNCGAKFQGERLFCPECGERIKNEKGKISEEIYNEPIENNLYLTADFEKKRIQKKATVWSMAALVLSIITFLYPFVDFVSIHCFFGFIVCANIAIINFRKLVRVYAISLVRPLSASFFSLMAAIVFSVFAVVIKLVAIIVGLLIGITSFLKNEVMPMI